MKRKLIILWGLAVWVFLLVMAGLSQGRTITVGLGGGYDFNTIQVAIDDSNDGDTIVVADGRYTGPGNCDIDFKGKAITVRSIEPNDPNVVASTIIDCNGTEAEPHRGFTFQSGERPNSILDGFTITNGYGPEEPDQWWGGPDKYSAGGAICCNFSSPTIRNCIITNNYGYLGGGIYCFYADYVLIANCTFKENEGDGLCNNSGYTTVHKCLFIGNSGCGMYARTYGTSTLTECEFRSNSGGGLYNYWGNVTLHKCLFIGNSGGGIYGNYDFPSYSGMLLTDCTFIGNQARQGGGMYIYGCGGWADLSNCIFTGNSAAYGGGGIRSFYDVGIGMTNCIFIGNSAGGNGGGISGEYGGIGLTDCAFIGNSAAYDGGAVSVYETFWGLDNCVFSGNCASSGGAIRHDPGEEFTMRPSVRNCTFTGNRASQEGGALWFVCGGAVTLTNCILWGNSAPQGHEAALIAGYESVASVTFSYCDVEGGKAEIYAREGYPEPRRWTLNWDEGNIDTDPCFAEPGYWDSNGIWVDGDYHLESQAGRWNPKVQSWVKDDVTSPCIDAGNPNSYWCDEPWPNGKRINMGAYGGTREASMSDAGSIADLNYDDNVNFVDYALFAGNWHSGNSMTIPRGSVTVDGDLSEWSENVEWVELDKVYQPDPNDVSEARFALRWDESTNKVYVAVVVNDSEHIFRDDFGTWDASDRLEVCSQGDAAGGVGWRGNYDIAQKYAIIPNTTGGCFVTWGDGNFVGSDTGLEYAVGLHGDLIIYEVGITQFDNYGGITGGETLLSNIKGGDVVGFDLMVDSRWSQGFGMLSENLMIGKHKDAGQFAKYTLVEKSRVPSCLELTSDLDRNCIVNLRDLVQFCDDWLISLNP